MQNIFFHQKIFHQKFLAFPAALLLAAALAILAGCGSGSTGTTGTGGTGGSTGGTGSSTGAPSLTIVLTQDGKTTNVIASGTTVVATATLRDAQGGAVPNTVVTFTSADATLATANPANGTALTNASGVATITLTGGASTGGATTLTATAQVTTVTAGVSAASAVTGSIGYAVGQGSAITLSNITFGIGAAPNALSAYGTTSLTLTVIKDGKPIDTPQLVTFSSTCANTVLPGAVPPANRATVSPPVYTLNGVATASYRDNGCAGADLITATVAGITSAPAQLLVSAPSSGSIQFVSATPPILALKGTGGKETSVVVFKVVDVGGNPISGKTVTFNVDVNATAGGVYLTPTPSTAISDSNGLVQIVVNSGPVSTPVRVAASTEVGTGANKVILNSTSNALTITTGIPDNDSFSLSASTFNIEGWNIDGTPTVMTIRVSDHFNNPVPDGTPVNFVPEGGSIIGTSGSGSCSTVGGTCTVTLTSQEPRPRSARNGYGRATVLAYAVGEESFTDFNGNGWVDVRPSFSPIWIPTEMVDASGISTDLGEAWVDYNENGAFEQNSEPFIDFNNNLEKPYNTYTPGVYDGPDGKYSGVLCDDVNLKDPSNPSAGTRSNAGSCAASKTIHVRKSQVIVFSSSFATIAINNATGVVNGTGLPAEPMYTWNFPDVATAITAVSGVANTSDIGVKHLRIPGDALCAPIGTNCFYLLTGATPPAFAGPAIVPPITTNNSGSHLIELPACDPVLRIQPITFIVTVVDKNGNAMPAGTTIAFSTDNGTIISPAGGFTVPNTNSCRTLNPLGPSGTAYPGCDATSVLASNYATFGDIPVTMKSDATWASGTPAASGVAATAATCANSTLTGTFTVTVTAPSGAKTVATMNVTD